jgi:hypothetical protein
VRAFVAAAVVLSATACGGGGDGSAGRAAFSAEVDHPLVPLSSVPVTVLAGTEDQARIRVESRVLDTSARIANADVAVVEVKEWEAGELVERTLDYYAQRADGGVWYFGERVDEYERGKIVGHKGQWRAGRRGAKAGLFMPAKPRVGQEFEQERAPGVAEDRSTVVAVGVAVATPAGKFSSCTKTRDFSPIDNVTELKWYCSGVGLVREQGAGALVQLVSYRRAASPR